MTTLRENRRHERRGCPEDMTVKYAYFNQAHYYDARLRNMSDGGVRITSRNELHKGAHVTIHFNTGRSARHSAVDRPRFRCVLAVVQVQWCRWLEDESAGEYEVGARYLFPVDESRQLAREE
jgi:hypothetical protein